MGTARRLLLVAVAMLPAGHAAAQTLPWPGDAPAAGASAPWPGERGAPGMSPMGPSSMGATPPRPMGGAGAGGGGAPPACMAEFNRLREEVEKKGMAAKAAGQKKVTRDEMCRYVTAYSDAEAKWVKYSEANVQSCGVPIQIVNQLKQVHSGTEQTRQKICAAGPVAAAPTLSDALISSPSATPQSRKSGSGTMDTLTGTLGK